MPFLSSLVTGWARGPMVVRSGVPEGAAGLSCASAGNESPSTARNNVVFVSSGQLLDSGGGRNGCPGATHQAGGAPSGVDAAAGSRLYWRAMGKHDNRRSMKMRRRRGQRKLKARLRRRKEARRAAAKP